MNKLQKSYLMTYETDDSLGRYINTYAWFDYLEEIEKEIEENKKAHIRMSFIKIYQINDIKEL